MRVHSELFTDFKEIYIGSATAHGGYNFEKILDRYAADLDDLIVGVHFGHYKSTPTRSFFDVIPSGAKLPEMTGMGLSTPLSHLRRRKGGTMSTRIGRWTRFLRQKHSILNLKYCSTCGRWKMEYEGGDAPKAIAQRGQTYHLSRLVSGWIHDKESHASI
jgi:hypothetical protein